MAEHPLDPDTLSDQPIDVLARDVFHRIEMLEPALQELHDLPEGGPKHLEVVEPEEGDGIAVWLAPNGTLKWGRSNDTMHPLKDPAALQKRAEADQGRTALLEAAKTLAGWCRKNKTNPASNTGDTKEENPLTARFRRLQIFDD